MHISSFQDSIKNNIDRAIKKFISNNYNRERLAIFKLAKILK
jgi:hypothetical protein